MLKKINAGLSLVTTLVLLAHIGIAFRTLNGAQLPIGAVMPKIVMALVILHALLSMMILFFSHEGNDMKYPANNIVTIVQRASGVLMLVPLFLSHMKVYGDAQMHSALYGLSEIAFFVLVGAHIGTSLPRALITLGALKTPRAVKIVSIIAAVVGAALAVDGIALAVRTFLV